MRGGTQLPPHIARYSVGMVSLRDRRTAAGLTQTELARRSGVAQPNIAAYERGSRVPSPATCRKIEAALRPTPSASLRAHRESVAAILERHRMSNPRVFGSVASGQDGPGSDLDLLVDASPGLDLLDIVDAAAELEALLGVPVDLVTSRSLRPGHEITATAVSV